MKWNLAAHDMTGGEHEVELLSEIAPSSYTNMFPKNSVEQDSISEYFTMPSVVTQTASSIGDAGDNGQCTHGC